MNQSTIIFGYIAAAFLIFITQRGMLPVYWGFLVASPKQPAAGPQATTAGKVSGADVSSLVETGARLAVMSQTGMPL